MVSFGRQARRQIRRIERSLEPFEVVWSDESVVLAWRESSRVKDAQRA